jgi:hypothetical protein
MQTGCWHYRMFTAAAFAALALARPATAARVTKVATPTLSCAGMAQASIQIQVCAGATGAPAGFSLQWMTAADYAANGNQWLSSDDPRLCGASFSGNANLSRYSLGPNECVTVSVGDFLFDNGASTNCGDALTCGTSYVVRAFAHATSTLFRSDFTANLPCATLPCGSTGQCTLTQGYWKTHGIVPLGNNEYTWPDSVKLGGLTLGTVNYNPQQLLDIFNTQAGGNGLIALAHQLIAAKLNVPNGADPTALGTAIADADALIGGLQVPPVGSGYLAPGVTSSLTSLLTSYNEGAVGPGHCD